ncbi:MAG: DUF1284 domain-containing protein [Actinomycetota bacterium]|nr:DUF1284 domain-containing protein [Actinomycetota bacterium]
MRTVGRPADNNTIKLRAHHLFCVYMFLGDGYDRAFTDNMERIAGICSSPARTVFFVEGVDDVCSACPFSDGVTCQKAGRDVAAMDAAAEEALGIEPGQLYIAHIMRARVAEAIRSGKYIGVCNGCSWFEGHCRPLIDSL